jgi:hypothetical protein
LYYFYASCFKNRFFYCIIFPTRVSAAILQIIHASTLITAGILYICNTEISYWYCQSMIEYHELMSILLVFIFSLPSGFVRLQLCYDMCFFFVLKIWYCQEITFLSKLSYHKYQIAKCKSLVSFNSFQWLIIVLNVYQCYKCVFNVYQCNRCVFNVHQWSMIVLNVYQCYRCVCNV